jgi:hypothetical protein
MIRIRRIPPRGLFKRSRYEAEVVDDVDQRVVWQAEMTVPAVSIDRFIGIQESWALTYAADEAWDHGSSEWITFPYSVS